jgi:hypothetical protein
MVGTSTPSRSAHWRSGAAIGRPKSRSFGPQVSTAVGSEHMSDKVATDVGDDGRLLSEMPSGAAMGPRLIGQQRSTKVPSAQSNPQLDSHIGREGWHVLFMACRRSELGFPLWKFAA